MKKWWFAIALLPAMLTGCSNPGFGTPGARRTTTAPGSSASAQTAAATTTTCQPSSTPVPATTFVTLGAGVSHVVYDPDRQLFWVTNSWRNEVEVLTTAGAIKTSVSVPEPDGIDVSADGNRIIVGTITPNLYVIDPYTFRVVDVATAPAWGPGNAALHPMLPLAAANGEVIALAGTGTHDADTTTVLEWNPDTNHFRDRTGSVGTPYAIARSADHSTIVVSAQSSYKIALYDSATDTFTQSGQLSNAGTLEALAVNADGSRIAIQGMGVEVLDRNFNVVSISDANFVPRVFSADGSQVYGIDNSGQDMAELNLASLNVSYVPFGDPATPMALAPDGRVMTLNTFGLGFVDPAAVHVPQGYGDVQLPTGGTILDPGNGTLNQLSQLIIMGSLDTVYIGNQATCTDGLDVTLTPAAAAALNGPQNLTVVSPSGDFVIAPGVYSNQPVLRSLSPVAAPPSGGDPITVFGYGLMYDSSSLSGTVAGQSTPVGPVVTASTLGDAPNLDSMEVGVPSSGPGWADVTVTTPGGVARLPNDIYYLKAETLHPAPAGLAQLLFDPTRDLVYGLVGDAIETFSPATDAFTQLVALPNPSPAGAAPAGLALTPDGSKLLVGDGTSLLILDPDHPSTVTTVPVASGVSAVATTNQNSALIGNDSGELFELHLDTLALASLGYPSSQAFSPMASTPDGSTVVGSGFLWHSGTLTLNASLKSYGDSFMAVSDDGQHLAVSDSHSRPVFLSSDFTPEADAQYVDGGSMDTQDPGYNLSNDQPRFGAAFDHSGALFFVPLARMADPTQDAIDVYDTQSGRLRLRIPLPGIPAVLGNVMAFDDTSNTLYVLTQAGLDQIELPATLPLALASVHSGTPMVAGATVTVTGSGFTGQTTLTLNGAPIEATEPDPNTLQFVLPLMPAGPVSVSVTNPDGDHDTWDDAFSVW